MEFFYDFAQNSLYVRLIASLLLLFFFFFGRKLLSRLAIRLVSRIKVKHNLLEFRQFDSLQLPFNYLFLCTGIYIALAISPFVSYPKLPEDSFWFISTAIPISILPFSLLTNIYSSVIAALVTWIIYQLEHVYEPSLSSLTTKLPFMDNSLFIRFLAKMIRFLTVLVGSFISISLLFPDFTKILTGVGIGGVAVAFIGKDALANILSGALLMMDKPFVINDWIELCNLEGVVEDISFRSTRIRTFTQGLVVIPNSQIGNENIINWSRMEKRRVKFDLGIAYNTSIADIQQCIDGIKQILGNCNEVENETYLVNFESFGDYALNISIIYFSLETSYAPYVQVKEEVNLQILSLCEKLNIEIAFPTQTICMQS